MKHVFEPVSMSPLTMKNRLIRSATQDYYGSKEGFVTDRQVALVKAIVEHEVGMFITGHVCVQARGRVNDFQNAFYDDAFIEGQSHIAKTIHEYGSKAILQISHAGAAAESEGHRTRLSPSGVPYFFGKRPEPVVTDGEKSPSIMSLQDIEELKSAFVQAAIRAKKAGYDGVQLHFAHSYLISQFLNPLYNLRQDAYGGSKENRIRLGLEIISDIKKELGDTFPILIKINSNIEQGDEAFEEDFYYYIQALSQAGVTAIEISGWDFTPLGRQGQKLYYGKRAKKAASLVKTPIILLGGVRSLVDAEEILQSDIQFVSLARPFIREPDVSSKLKQGETAKCISCSKCFIQYFKDGRFCIFH